MLPLRSRPPSPFKELLKIKKRNRYHRDPYERTHNHTTGHKEVSQTDSIYWIILLKISKKTLLAYPDRNSRLVHNKKFNPTQVARRQARIKQARLSQILVDSRLNFTQSIGEKKTIHQLYWPTCTWLRKKEKNKRSTPYSPLPVGSDGKISR